MKTEIIYEDAQLIVARKPAGLATQTARVGEPDMVSELKNYLKSPYLGVIHRLDQPVEGLLVFAKDKQTAATLTKQLSVGSLNKQYYALVCGQVADTSGELVDYLTKEKDGKAKVVTGKEGQYPDAKKAMLQYQVVRQSESIPVALMDIHIDTGRFHQIRAQMAHAGMPLLGDRKYGTQQALEMAGQLGIKTVALCAYQLECTQPKTGKKLTFQIEPKWDFPA